MERPATSSSSKLALKLLLLLLALLLSPAIVSLDGGTITYVCALFYFGQYSWEQGVYVSGLAAPGFVLVALVESVPGLLFFAKIHGVNQSGSIRGLVIISVATTTILSILTPLILFPPLSFEFGRYISDPASNYPVFVLVGLIFIPAFVHESCLLVPVNTKHLEGTATTIQSNRVASLKAARRIGLVVGTITFIMPAFLICSGSVPFHVGLQSAMGQFNSTLYPYGVSSGFSFFYSIIPAWFLAYVLAFFSVRIAFAHRLILYCRGIGEKRKVLTIGVISEGLTLLTYPFQAMPLPFLFLLGLALVKFRDSFISKVAPSDFSVWPLTLEEEAPMVAKEPSPRPESA